MRSAKTPPPAELNPEPNDCGDGSWNAHPELACSDDVQALLPKSRETSEGLTDWMLQLVEEL